MWLERDPARWLRLEETASTNAHLLAGGFPSGTVCLARSQTAGRGRQGRQWFARPDQSLIFSALLVPPPGLLPPARLRLLPLLCGAALLSATRRSLEAAEATKSDRGENRGDAAAPRLFVKWPNDLYLRREGATGKLAGVLVESSAGGGQADFRAVLGIGLNWSGPVPEIPAGERMQAPPVALFPEGAPFGPERLAELLVPELNRRLEELAGPGAPPFLDELRAAHYLEGRAVRRGELRAIARGITEDGALILERVDTGERILCDDPDLGFTVD